MIKIFNEQQFTSPNFPSLIFQAVEVPPGLPTQHIHRQLYDDRSVLLPHGDGSIWISVYEGANPIEIGSAVFALDGVDVKCDGVDVHEKHRGQGIASEIYRLAKQITGLPLAPSETQTMEAVRLWERLLHYGIAS
jgi:hypothetical protein